MRQALKGLYLLGFVLVVGFLSICGVSIVMGANTTGTVEIKLNDLKNGHRVRIKSLNLGTLESSGITGYYEVAVKNLDSFDIINGLAVWTGSGIFDGSYLYMIGGGLGNQVLAGNSAGIAGGESNKVRKNNVVIGGGKSNLANGDQSVIGGGSGNQTHSIGGVILGGIGNNAKDYSNSSIILGGQNNIAEGENSLLFGNSAKTKASSFSWNDGTLNMNGLLNDGKAANIGASGGILIGTYNKLPGEGSKVNLVVSGAVKIAGSDILGSKGEIRMFNGCFYAYDGSSWHVFGKNSKASSDCGGFGAASVSVTCKFGKVELQEGDRVKAYSQPYATDCDALTIKNNNVVCRRKTLPSGELTGALMVGLQTNYIYPSCYEVSVTPTL